jgi:hypothetical protein
VKPGRWDDRQHAEHLRIVDIRTREGRSAAEIAVELWCSYRTVQRYRLELRAQGVSVEPWRPLPPHGTSNRYQNHRCRCDACRAAESARKRAYRQRRMVRPLASRREAAA